jgi:hypothetical protein
MSTSQAAAYQAFNGNDAAIAASSSLVLFEFSMYTGIRLFAGYIRI